MIPNILVDGFVLEQRFRNSGSYVYANNVIGSLLRLDDSLRPKIQIARMPDSSSNASQVDITERADVIQVPQLRDITRWRLGMGGAAMRKLGGDVVYCPAPINCTFLKSPALVTIHDASIVKSPSQTWLRNSVERAIIWSAVRSATRIITDSENSRRDLMEVYGIPSNKISVIYLGYDRSVFSANTAGSARGNPIRQRLGIKRPYLLHHGIVQPRKNLQRLIMAFELLLKRCPDLDLDLVLAGPIGWRSEEIVAAANRLQGRVILTGPVTQEDLVALIRSAVLCVIPSLYEGFCLPLLECMACGVPTIAARSSCLPEISGGILRYFDPLSIEDMATAIHAGICDDELRRDLAAKGLRRAQQFSWTHCAQETLDVLTEVAGFSNSDRNTTRAESLAV